MAARSWIRDHWKAIVYGVGGCLLGFWVLRSCVPGLNRGLPAEVVDSIQRQYTVCITDTPILPGEPREPSCGQVNIAMEGDGVVPSSRRAVGVSRAFCYKVTYTTPHWTTLGTTRHEIDWSGRIASKVAIVQDGAWQTYPDREDQDASRWSEFSCPTSYESGTVPIGG